jgi:hypothetical protein
MHLCSSRAFSALLPCFLWLLTSVASVYRRMSNVTLRYESVLPCTHRQRLRCTLAPSVHMILSLIYHRALFLLERVRIVRAPFLERSRDYVWITGTVMTICGYAGILAFEFEAPMAALSLETGICRIGIQPAAAETLVVFDTALNITLTGIFIWQLRMSFGSPINRSPSNTHNTVQQPRKSICRLPTWEKHGLGSTGRSSSENNLRLMLMRNVIGCVLLMVNTIVNQATFLTRSFATMAHACLLMCLTDSKSTCSIWPA